MTDEQIEQDAKAEALATKRAQKEALRNFNQVRTAALTLAEYQHGQDADVIASKKEVTEVNNKISQIKLDLQQAHRELKEANKEYQCCLEQHIPDEFQLGDSPSPKEEDCKPCKKNKEGEA